MATKLLSYFPQFKHDVWVLKGESMNKASLSFLVVVFAVLLMSFESQAQWNTGNLISERVQQNLRMNERLRIADLLRLSLQEQRSLQITSLTLTAQSLVQGPAQVQLLDRGQIIATEQVRKQLKEIRIPLSGRVSLESLELIAQSEILLETIAVEVVSAPIPQPIPQPIPRPIPDHQWEQQVAPNSLVTIRLNQVVRGSAILQLDQLLRQQQNLSLQGAQIERVVVQAQPMRSGRSASVQVELNRRLVGSAKYIAPGDRQTPLPVNSFEEVRSLALVVNGDAQILDIKIRVGQVRPQGPQYPQTQIQRVHVGQEVSNRYPLDLVRLLGNDTRLVSAVTIEARSSRTISSIVRLSSFNEILGTVSVSQYSSRARIQLRRPVSISELRLESLDSAIIDTLELEVEAYRNW